uniref:Uncharacterized protein n=1 Tax=Rhizophora mucronata TaxID=61149 RepID=A0A2P2QDK5_RHIMU
MAQVGKDLHCIQTLKSDFATCR